MSRTIEIKNYPLPQYASFKDFIILKHSNPSISLLIYMSFICLSAKYKYKNKIDFIIVCPENKKQWIHPDITWFENVGPCSYIVDLENPEIEKNISRILEINHPLEFDYSKFISKENNQVLICCNGLNYYALKNEIEKDLYFYYKQRKYETKVLCNPEYPDQICELLHIFGKDLVISSDYSQLYDSISSSEIIIGTDNPLIMLANVFSNKKVYGIFGPSMPNSSFKINSMNIIQFSDTERLPPTVKKSCPCTSPKFCHKSFYFNSNKIPYCLDKISSNDLIKKINEFNKIF